MVFCIFFFIVCLLGTSLQKYDTTLDVLLQLTAFIYFLYHVHHYSQIYVFWCQNSAGGYYQQFISLILQYRMLFLNLSLQQSTALLQIFITYTQK